MEEREHASRDPEIHGGAWCFSGTRVPVATLWEHLAAGRSLEDFLTGYPSVEQWQVEAEVRRRGAGSAVAFDDLELSAREYSVGGQGGAGAASGEQDELGKLLGHAVAEEIRRARENGANVVVNFEGYPIAVPATAVRLESDGPGPGIIEWCEGEVEAHPVDPTLMSELRRIIPQEKSLLCWLCSVSGWLGGARPLDRCREDPMGVVEAARRAVSFHF